MASITSVEDVRRLVKSAAAMVAEDVQALIETEELEIVRRFGAHYSTAVGFKVTEVKEGHTLNIFLHRRFTSIISIKEDDSTALDSSSYRAFGNQALIERLPAGRLWGNIVEVEYVPEDDTAARRAVTVELVRIAIERTAMKSESVAGEYSFTAPDWDVERMRA